MTFKVSDNQYGRPHSSDSWTFVFDEVTNKQAVMLCSRHRVTALLTYVHVRVNQWPMGIALLAY